jgi:putative ABC transport system substrate-binding protein
LASLKRCLFGLILIALACAGLLLSDWNQRSATGGVRRIAILQHVSQPLLDDGVAGILDGLAAAGFVDGKSVSARRFNAENDIATANAIAKEITSGEYEVVLTASTLSLQAVANANRAGRAKHVFGIVADPASAGVGISRENPLEHPRHLVGIGTFLPVKPAFELAKRLNPALKTIGVVWNPGESNSEAFTKKAREACQELGLELREATIENSSGVLEAAGSLVSRGVDALWVGGDVTVMVAIDSVITAARRGGSPVFSIVPPSVERGAIFDFGANFYEVGKDVGALAAEVLRGADMTKIPIRNVVPERILINTTAVKGLKQQWHFPNDLMAKADVIIDTTGRHEKARAR